MAPTLRSHTKPPLLRSHTKVKRVASATTNVVPLGALSSASVCRRRKKTSRPNRTKRSTGSARQPTTPRRRSPRQHAIPDPQGSLSSTRRAVTPRRSKPSTRGGTKEITASNAASAVGKTNEETSGSDRKRPSVACKQTARPSDRSMATNEPNSKPRKQSRVTFRAQPSRSNFVDLTVDDDSDNVSVLSRNTTFAASPKKSDAKKGAKASDDRDGKDDGADDDSSVSSDWTCSNGCTSRLRSRREGSPSSTPIKRKVDNASYQKVLQTMKKSREALKVTLDKLDDEIAELEKDP